MTDVLYLVFVLILLCTLVAYIFIKDKENLVKIARLEKAIEENNKNIHYLKKVLETKADIDMAMQNDLDENELKILIEKEINTKIVPILKSLKGFESVIGEFQSEQENRLSHLEQKTQNMSKLSPDYNDEEQKIIGLFKNGKSVEQIAKDLRISTGNVEFALKFNKLMD